VDRGSYRSLTRVALILVGVVTLVALAIGWCVANRAGKSQALVQRFTEMLDHGNVTGAAALTSYPSAAADSIRQLVTGMSPGRADYRPSQVINLSDTDAFFTVNATWHFGPDRNWAYSVQGTARKLAVGWRISWDPQLLLPGLGRGRTGALVRTYAPSPRVTAAGGVPLMSEQTVNMVEFDAAHAADRVASATSLANALVDVAPLVTTIVTECDEVVTPCNKQFRSGPRVTNVVLQDRRSSAAAGDVRSPTTSQGRRSGRRRE